MAAARSAQQTQCMCWRCPMDVGYAFGGVAFSTFALDGLSLFETKANLQTRESEPANDVGRSGLRGR